MTKEPCAYCGADINPFGCILAFVKMENRSKSFCGMECYNKYLDKSKEVEIMQIKEDLWDILTNLGELKAEDPEKYEKTISVIEDLIKLLEGSAGRILALLEKLG